MIHCAIIKAIFQRRIYRMVIFIRFLSNKYELSPHLTRFGGATFADPDHLFPYYRIIFTI